MCVKHRIGENKIRGPGAFQLSPPRKVAATCWLGRHRSGWGHPRERGRGGGPGPHGDGQRRDKPATWVPTGTGSFPTFPCED